MKVFILLLLAAGCFASLLTPAAEERKTTQSWSPETQQKINRHSAFRTRLYDCKERLAQGSGLRAAAADLVSYCEAFYPCYLILVADAENKEALEEAVARNLIRLFDDDQASDPSMLPAYRATRFRLERELQNMESRI